MANVQQLLVQIDATTEVLRRELKRAEQPLGQFEAKSKATTAAQDQLAAAMRRNAQAIAVLQGPLGAISGRFSSLGALIGSVNPLIAASTVAVAGFATTLGRAVAAAENYERATLKTEAILTATGNASGQTADSIRQMSREIARATLASVQGVESAAQKLLTFRSVTGSTFRRTLELSQDLAEVGFGSIETAVVQLGKALEDPEKGMTALTRVGVSFSEQQKEVIKTLYESGDVLGAQEKLLEAVAIQVGGAGRAASGGLTGAYDSLGQSAEELLEKIGRTSGALSIQMGLIDFLDKAIRGLDLAVFGDTSRDLISLENQRLKILDEISASELAGNAALADADRQRLAAIEAQIQALIKLQEAGIRAKKSADEAAEATAAQARAAQESDRATAVETFIAALREQIEVEKLSDAERGKRQAADKAEAEARKAIAGITAEQVKRIREVAEATEAEKQALKKARDETNAKAKEDLKIADARKEAVQDLQDERDHQDRLRTAHEQGAQAVEDVEDAYEALQIIRKLKLDSDSEEAQKIVGLVVEINKQKRAIDGIKDASKDAEKAANDLAKAQEKAAKEAADAYKEVMDRIRDFTEQALGDEFFTLLKGETVDFAEFFERTILRTVANVLASIATQQIVMPIAAQLVGGMPGLFGLTGQAAGVASAAGGGLFGNPLSSLGNIASLVTGGPSSLATGFVTSQLGAALGLSSTVGPATALGVAAVPGGLSAAAGGAAGGVLAPTAAGSALIGAAPFLGIAALAAPLLLGSLFGRNPSVGPTGVARLPNVIGTSEIVGTTDNGGDSSAAESVAQSIRDISTSAAETLGFFGQRAFGLDVGNFPQPEDGSSQAAGFNLKRIVDNILESSDFATGLTAEQAVTEGVRETLQRAFDGVDVPQIATALENSSAETIEELLSDLDLANAIGTFAAGGREALEELTRPLTAVEQAFQNLADAAEEGTERAQELGLSVDEATAYFDDLRAQLEETTQAAFTARERELSGQGFLNQVQALLDQRATDARDAVAAGLDVNSTAGNLFNLGLAQVLEQLTEAQRAIIASTFTDQQIQDAITVFNDFAAANDNVASTMADFADELQASIASIDDEISARQQSVDDLQRLVTGLQQGRIGRAINPELSIFDPQEQFRIAMEEFTRISGLAAGGDLEAVAQFDDVANATLQSALAAFGRSDSRFAQVFNQIQSSSLQVEDLTVTQIGIAQQQLNELQSIREALGAQSTSQQDLGSRPTRNRILADLTGYTGDFGGGGFQQFLATAGLPQGILDSVNQVISAIPFANGGIMTSRGPLPLHTYASGGIADAPQLAMFGEGRMPEAFVPLPNGRSIPVQFQGGGGANDNRMVGLMERLVEVNEALVRVVGAGNEEMAEQSTLLRREIRRYAQEVRAAG